MIDRSYIGTRFPPHTVEIEKGQLRFFAVAEKFEDQGERGVRLELQAANQDGEVTLAGQAIVALP
jgi:hypothetical protein